MPVVWVNPWTFRVRHPVSGRATDVIIPGLDRMEKARQENLIAWQTEETLEELAGPEVNVRSQPFSKGDQHDLGKVLVGIEDTDRLVRATGHGRYYQGVK